MIFYVFFTIDQIFLIILFIYMLQVSNESAFVFCRSISSARSSSLRGGSLPHVSDRIELVIPDLPRRCAFLKEQDHGFYTRTLEGGPPCIPCPEWRIGQDRITICFVLDIGKIFGQDVAMDDIKSLNAMQDHIHDGDDVGQGLFSLAIEGAFLEHLCPGCGQLGLVLHVNKGFT